MKLLYQTRFNVGDCIPRERGNCLAACIATIMGLPDAEDVFQAQEWYHSPNDVWSQMLLIWLSAHGWIWRQTDKHLNGRRANEPYLVIGKSPRGDWNHCVLYKNGKLFHDPHWNGTGVDGIIVMATLIFEPKLIKT